MHIYYQLVKDEERNFKRFYERAEYYEEQNDRTQALTNYVDSLDAYAKYIKYTEEISKFDMRDRTGYLPEKVSYSTEAQVTFLLNLAERLADIKGCDSDRAREAYIYDKTKIIFEVVRNYQKSFDVKQIETFKVLSRLVETTKDFIAQNQKLLEDIKKVKPADESDQTFKKIRVALLTISETNLCLTPLESNPGCFIATAAYSTSIHPDLDTFRSLRDEKLLPHPLGKKLVTLYYKISPTIAQYIEKQPTIKQTLKYHLARLANWMRRKKITTR